jgi:hypothetical protein
MKAHALKFSFLIGLMVLPLTFVHADLLIEPIVGIHMGGKDGQAPNRDKFTGNGYGARIGVQKLGLMAGIDYQSHGITIKDNPTEDASMTETSLFVGYDAPILFRVWAAYLLSGEVKYKGGTGKDTDGSGFKVGVGLKLIPLLSLNLEYRKYEYAKNNGNKIDPVSENNSMFLSVSLPLTF